MFVEKDLERFTGEPLRLYDFMNEFVVRCPKCDGCALINVPKVFDTKNAILKCNDCHFSEKAIDRIRYKTSGKALCHECRKQLDSDIRDRKEIPSFVNVTCSECGTVNKISENWESYMMKYNDDGIIDPAFGLPLWYQDEVKGNVLWAFNYSHLLEIKNYVSSKLRERTTSRFRMTMVEKLPSFIKSAKNRDEVLHAIERMEKTKK